MTGRPVKGRRALGKGLSALIPGAKEAAVDAGRPRDYFICPVDRVHPQPGQPRQQINDGPLTTLSDSIKEKGIIQPVVVRRLGDGEGYEIIAGERRWRAAQLAGLKEIPVVVKEMTPLEAFETALVENIQREDLNPIEEAEAFRRLIDEHEYTQAQVAERIGRNRTTVTNSLRLLGLPPEVRDMVLDGRLSEGHARAVLQVTATAKLIALAREAIAKGLSVRQTEQRARTEAGKSGSAKAGHQPTTSPETKSLVARLQRSLGARVKLQDRKGKGRLEITYTSYKELDRILDKILK
jgi:ParB family chromosome partitioning protein